MNTSNVSQPTRESIPDAPNRLGLDGIEFVEFATTRPQALAQVLEAMGFQPAARHRSREVTLYRQGTMNLVINAHPDDARVSAIENDQPVVSAVALRVRDAARAFERCIELGAWEVASHARAMELNIPGIAGPGGSRFHFVDRHRDFSIFDIDFVPIPGVQRQPPALVDLNFFGIVQYVAFDRADDWQVYFESLFDFVRIPDDERFGILPKGKLMRSPCGSFLWQIIEPEAGLEVEESVERLERIGLGTADVAGAVALLKARGIEFVESALLHPDDRGALTRTMLGSVAFELVHRPA